MRESEHVPKLMAQYSAKASGHLAAIDTPTKVHGIDLDVRFANFTGVLALTVEVWAYVRNCLA
jgi:hypothetical protein